MKLYEITYELEASLDALLNEETLSIDEIGKALEPLKMQFNAKAINISSYIGNLEATAEAIKIAERDMMQRRKTLENRTQSIKAYLKVNMIKNDIKKISCPYFDIFLRKSKGKVIIDNQVLLPDRFIRTTTIKEPDKIKIKEDLDNHKSVPGAHLENSQSLIIK